MTLDPFAGRALARAHPRCLAVNRDGVFHWPGIALLRRRGDSFRLLDQNRLNDLLGSFYGPDAIYRPVRAALEAAGSCLRRSDAAAARCSG